MFLLDKTLPLTPFVQAASSVEAAAAKAAEAVADLQRRTNSLKADLEAAHSSDRAVREEWGRAKVALQEARDEVMSCHASLARGANESSEELSKVRTTSNMSFVKVLHWMCTTAGAEREARAGLLNCHVLHGRSPTQTWYRLAVYPSAGAEREAQAGHTSWPSQLSCSEQTVANTNLVSHSSVHECRRGKRNTSWPYELAF